MSTNEKLLLLWLLVVVVFSFVFRHFWASAIYALGKAIAMNLILLPGTSMFTAGMFGMHFLP